MFPFCAARRKLRTRGPLAREGRGLEGEEGKGSEETTWASHREERTPTEAREERLIEVSTFKVAKTRGLPRTGDIIYLFTPHSITAA